MRHVSCFPVGMLLRCSLGLGLFVSVLFGLNCGGTVTGNGHSTGGGGSGGGGVGSGGTLPERCKLPQVTGPCEAAFQAYWHDPKTGACEPFIYGGCQGNENRFSSIGECQQACKGGSHDMDACSEPAECMLATPGCCASCDPVDARAFVAINRVFANQYGDASGCSGGSCGACPDVPDRDRTSEYYTATCNSGRCEVLDVRKSPITECTKTADCILRDGVECCQGCDGTGIVAINRDADLESLVCAGAGQACPLCVPQIPPKISAICSGGRCERVIAEGP
jgi:hypothetical protein